MYLRFLKQLADAGQPVVSCPQIAAKFRLDATQVRKDLAVTGIVGKAKVGYEIGPLITAVETFLGWNNYNDAFLVGVGHLGTALLGYEGFRDYAFQIVAAFDTDPAKIGTVVHGREILPLAKLPDLVARMHIHLGVITVPAEAAQNVADVLTASGITGLWNFAPVMLAVPEGVIVENVQLSTSLAVLTSKVRRAALSSSEET